MDKKIIVITGATASGKTKISINLAKSYNAEIICADSRIVYKNLDIVSAKPTLAEQDGVVHHLIDILEPTQDFSAGDFSTLAKEKIKEIHSKGKNVIICGGTWFYIKSLLDSKTLPECPINQELRNKLSKLSNEELWEKLNSLDSTRASLIHPNNKDKVIRSIEMCISLNQPISSYQREDNEKYDANWYMPSWDREVLYERINLRVDEMIKMGLFEEWKRNKELYPNSKIMQNTIGYSEFYDLEKGIYPSIDVAIDKIKQYTRNFAKRQLTYFRSNKEIKPINNENDILEDISNA
ncbi:MAG: tRNA (adenosine(37)-N6)-dimethylallyltransferase MiaA [Candidatus Gastranaerophilales bacterium]|nr:tRNA (adenosine(37)-N6)-dimethylallyltransferase MiaA [Candidatus Gastranaerophilales bacterium]